MTSVFVEENGYHAATRHYAFRLAQLDAVSANAEPIFIHHDGLGSVTDLTTTGGTPMFTVLGDDYVSEAEAEQHPGLLSLGHPCLLGPMEPVPGGLPSLSAPTWLELPFFEFGPPLFAG